MCPWAPVFPCSWVCYSYCSGPWGHNLCGSGSRGQFWPAHPGGNAAATGLSRPRGTAPFSGHSRPSAWTRDWYAADICHGHLYISFWREWMKNVIVRDAEWMWMKNVIVRGTLMNVIGGETRVIEIYVYVCCQSFMSINYIFKIFLHLVLLSIRYTWIHTYIIIVVVSSIIVVVVVSIIIVVVVVIIIYIHYLFWSLYTC